MALGSSDRLGTKAGMLMWVPGPNLNPGNDTKEIDLNTGGISQSCNNALLKPCLG